MNRATMPTLEEVLALGRAKAGGAVAVDHGGEREANEPPMLSVAEAERLRARRRAVRAHGFGLRPDVAELVVTGRLYDTEPLSIATAWALAPTPVLVLCGDPGVGKSVGCASAALDRIASGPLAYVLESDLAEWRWARRKHEADWQRLIEAGTVVVDELGLTESARAELARVAVAELVHHRSTGWPRGRKTMLVGNVGLEELTDALDPRLIDRLAEFGSVRHVTGPSLRGRR